jgi:hypothetical protein
MTPGPSTVCQELLQMYNQALSWDFIRDIFLDKLLRTA